jgi:hypothetical protein
VDDPSLHFGTGEYPAIVKKHAAPERNTHDQYPATSSAETRLYV